MRWLLRKLVGNSVKQILISEIKFAISQFSSSPHPLENIVSRPRNRRRFSTEPLKTLTGKNLENLSFAL